MSKYAMRQTPCHIGQLPTAEQGPRFLAVSIPYSAAQIQDDLVIENENGAISNVQTLFIDTASGAPDSTSFTITLLESLQKIVVKPKTQGYYPILCGDQVQFTVDFTGGTSGSIYLAFLNIPVPPVQWATP